jgi:hypothetical protein
MTIEFDSNRILSKKEREERVLDLYFNQNKNYRQIAQVMKMSVRDIGEIVNRAKQEKERQEPKSLSVQAYEHFSKGKTPLQVSVILNIGQAQVTQYYTQYLSLVQLDDITKIYLEFKGDVSYFVNLCEATKAAKMGILQVVNLLRIANNNLPSVQRRYNQLQKQNNNLESNLSIAAREFQNLSDHISFMGNRLDELKSECENEIARLQDLRYQTANLQTVINELKNDDNGEYTKVITAVKEEIQKNLSNIKPLLDLALFSIIQSMRENPDKYSCLVYSDNPRLIVDSNYRHISSGRQQQQSQYGDYSIEDCKAEILDQAKEFYILLVDRIVCEVVNGCVTNLSGTTSVPALPLEEGGVDNDK